MEGKIWKLGYYLSIVSIVAISAHLFWTFNGMLSPEEIRSNLSIPIAAVIILTGAVGVPKLPVKFRMAYVLLFTSWILVNLANWTYGQNFQLSIGLQVIALVLGIFAFWKFRRLRSAQGQGL